MGWCQTGNRPLPEPFMTNLPTHIYASLDLNGANLLVQHWFVSIPHSSSIHHSLPPLPFFSHPQTLSFSILHFLSLSHLLSSFGPPSLSFFLLIILYLFPLPLHLWFSPFSCLFWVSPSSFFLLPIICYSLTLRLSFPTPLDLPRLSHSTLHPCLPLPHPIYLFSSVLSPPFSFQLLSFYLSLLALLCRIPTSCTFFFHSLSPFTISYFSPPPRIPSLLPLPLFHSSYSHIRSIFLPLPLHLFVCPHPLPSKSPLPLYSSLYTPLAPSHSSFSQSYLDFSFTLPIFLSFSRSFPFPQLYFSLPTILSLLSSLGPPSCFLFTYLYLSTTPSTFLINIFESFPYLIALR